MDELEVRRRNIVLCILFSFITCGLYMFYWTYVVSRDTRILAGESPEGAGLDVLFDFLTCGIFGFIVMYKCAKRMYEVDYRNNGRASDDSTLVTILYFFVAVVSLGILQSKINAYAYYD
ncbi:MAG: DUF4234 domain-containing protein [Defluviitaleaceae bacterium]|nr:DUF4234 domain-containing protein [Defluviitaleaceae bacterium]